MGITHHPHGVSSFGVPLPTSSYFPMNGRKHLWVRGVSTGLAPTGSNSAPGDNPDEPLLTMARAFALVESGGVIHFTGNIREQLDTPAGIFDVTVIGEGTLPRHADAHTGNNGYSAATWKPPASPAATTPLLRVRQQGWRFYNILWASPTDDAALEFMRDAGAGDLERDSSHSEVCGCRFAGGQDGILISGTEIVHDLHINNSIFNDATGSAIKAPAYYGRRAIIEDNIFDKNVNHIVAALGESYIRRNLFTQHTTMSIDLNGGNGLNVITGNFLSGTYSVGGGYRKANANDDWGGNWNTGVGVLTTADPA